jgi:hypothetical protein
LPRQNPKPAGRAFLGVRLQQKMLTAWLKLTAIFVALDG